MPCTSTDIHNRLFGYFQSSSEYQTINTMGLSRSTQLSDWLLRASSNGNSPVRYKCDPTSSLTAAFKPYHQGKLDARRWDEINYSSACHDPIVNLPDGILLSELSGNQKVISTALTESCLGQSRWSTSASGGETLLRNGAISWSTREARGVLRCLNPHQKL
ncbi:hypothetical protein BGZ60DRAFT_434813 [Tricladium varicosporioides]|nr:hypothetical protein BGZ60DRAFT_434813 [Hymenoscyphus varicosporioides]